MRTATSRVWHATSGNLLTYGCSVVTRPTRSTSSMGAHALEARLEQGEGAAQIHGRLVGDCPDLLERAERETGQLENQPLRAAALDTVRWRRGHVAPDSGHVPAARLPAAYNPETPVA